MFSPTYTEKGWGRHILNNTMSHTGAHFNTQGEGESVSKHEDTFFVIRCIRFGTDRGKEKREKGRKRWNEYRKESSFVLKHGKKVPSHIWKEDTISLCVSVCVCVCYVHAHDAGMAVPPRSR